MLSPHPTNAYSRFRLKWSAISNLTHKLNTLLSHTQALKQCIEQIKSDFIHNETRFAESFEIKSGATPALDHELSEGEMIPNCTGTIVSITMSCRLPSYVTGCNL